jgi:phage terminase small subunit
MTSRQRRFVELILADGHHNATRAAREAGYAWPGKAGPRLMATAGVGDVIRDEIRRRAEEAWQEALRRTRQAAAEVYATLPAWYRLGLPRPACRRRRRKCM